MKPTTEKVLNIISSSAGYKVTEEEVISKTTLDQGDYIDITSSLNYHFELELTVDSLGFDKWETVGDYVNYVLKQ